MTVSSATTILTWAMVTVGAAAVVSAVLLKRWAARILVVAVGLLFAVVVFAVRQQISDLPRDSADALCTGGVSWFGLQITAGDDICARFR